MNKVFCILLALLALTLCACGAPERMPQAPSHQSVPAEPAPETTAEPEEILHGYILSFNQEGFTVNRIAVKELDKGSVASSQEGENIDPVDVRLLPDTVYEKKLVYDANGSRVETESMTREELELDRTLVMTGYLDQDTFVAEQVTMMVFLF